MTEEFLYYMWQHRLFSLSDLFTTEGELVSIKKVGERNTNSGPDFLNAAVQIGDTLWIGNIEIHLKSSGWILHKHSTDKAYKNVVLHVVYEHDKDVFSQDEVFIPTLELNKHHVCKYFDHYQNFLTSSTWIPCEKLINTVNQLTVKMLFQRLVVERFEMKIKNVERIFAQTKGSWEETFYHLLAYYFGSSLNMVVFERLAKSINLNIISKHKQNLLQLEALFFGQAGFLEENFTDEYPNALQTEYRYLSYKYQLTSLEKHLWQFFRLRPSNFPTIRISQFAALIHYSQHLSSKVISAENIESFSNYFLVSASEYWNIHYQFDKPATHDKTQRVGEGFANGLLINAVAPFLFYYGIQHDEKFYKERALALLEKLPLENNTIIRNWKACGVNAENALESQALLQLYKNYCQQKRCLQCTIGYKIISQKK